MMMTRKRLKQRSKCVSPFRFFTIILPPTPSSSILHHHHFLRLPKAFAAEFGDHISGVATLIVPTGAAWKVHLLKKDDQQLYFGEGWAAFMNYNHVKHGYFLQFEYLPQHTNVSFNVHIYDLSCCEITYPHHSQIPVDPDNDSTFGSKEASFRIQARSSHYFTTSSYMHIPIKFREKYMRETTIRWVKLEAEDGREWITEICNSAVGFRIRGVGWSKFTKDIKWGVAAKFYRFILLSKDAQCFVFKVIPLASAAAS